MGREEFLDKHHILRNWYMDDERYGDGKGLSSGAETLGKMAAQEEQRAVRKQRMLYLFLLPENLWLKRLAIQLGGIKKLQKMLLMKPQVHYMVQVLELQEKCCKQDEKSL